PDDTRQHRELTQQPLPSLIAELGSEAPLCALPGRSRPFELGAARSGQHEASLTPIVARFRAEPSLRLQGAQGAAQCRAVEGEHASQMALSDRTDMMQRLQQSELSDVQTGASELPLVDTGESPGGSAEHRARAG